MDKKDKVLGFLKKQAKIPLLFEEIAVMLGVTKEDIKELTDILDELEVEGCVIKSKKGRYSASSKMGLVSGKYQGNERGFGFVLLEGDDLYISEDKSMGALNGDTVLAREIKSSRRREGEIVKILDRANSTVIGTYNDGVLIPDNRKLGNFVIQNKDKIYENQKVVARITDFEKMEGEVFVTLGSVGHDDTEMQAIMYNFGISPKFSDEVIAAAEKLSFEPMDLENRRDLRNLLTITIDGADARDLDDAISLESIEDGKFRLYVHIADVSNYVKANSLLDEEAFDRGTSCYFPDRVAPMLPEALSNGICSLHPNVDRLTVTTIMDIDENGVVGGYEITTSVINSNFRMVYEDVTEMLEDSKSPLWDKYGSLRDMLFDMEKLSKILRQRRFERGSIDFNIPESKIVLDENGKVVDIFKREHTVSHKLIEEFMLACNRTVAEHAFWAEIPFVYRVHEEPKAKKIETFITYLGALGYKVRGKMSNKRMAELLAEVSGEKEEKVINTLALRSMMKAKYNPENLGHFGLDATYYCHFTSPIRRYPDLACHRIIKESLNGGNPYKFKDFTYKASVHSSEREEAAENAERDADRYKMCEFMESNIGKEYKGIVSSTTSFGFFVELDNTIEGLVRLEALHDDYYNFDDKSLTITGERRGKTIKIGDEVTVLVADANKETRRIDFELVGR